MTFAEWMSHTLPLENTTRAAGDQGAAGSLRPIEPGERRKLNGCGDFDGSNPPSRFLY